MNKLFWPPKKINGKEKKKPGKLYTDINGTRVKRKSNIEKKKRKKRKKKNKYSNGKVKAFYRVGAEEFLH